MATVNCSEHTDGRRISTALWVFCAINIPLLAPERNKLSLTDRLRFVQIDYVEQMQSESF